MLCVLFGEFFGLTKKPLMEDQPATAEILFESVKIPLLQYVLTGDLEERDLAADKRRFGFDDLVFLEFLRLFRVCKGLGLFFLCDFLFDCLVFAFII